jgi:hypothetical protein
MTMREDHGRNDDGKRRNGRMRGSGSRNDDTVKVIERREKKKREGGKTEGGREGGRERGRSSPRGHQAIDCHGNSHQDGSGISRRSVVTGRSLRSRVPVVGTRGTIGTRTVWEQRPSCLPAMVVEEWLEAFLFVVAHRRLRKSEYI